MDQQQPESDDVDGLDVDTRSFPSSEETREVFLHPNVSRFEIVRLVGSGGMGNVFLAVDPVLQRNVALKIPRLDLRNEPELRRRFLREARAMASLSHPNLVSILEIGEEGPTIFLVLEWCDGPNLGEWLARQEEPLTAEFVADLVALLAETLEQCHQQGVIHRDLKPSNILLEKSPVDNSEDDHFPYSPKLSDFGLARILEEGFEQTDSSLLMGTPQYMAPEQAECRHQDVGPQTDVYALGIILYQLLTGTLPFRETTAIRLLDQVRHEEPPSPTELRKDVPKSLQIICQKCINKRPEDRYQSAGEMAADLRRFCDGKAIVGRPIPSMTRLNRWLERPARLYNAGLMVIASNSAIILWMALVFVQDASGGSLLFEVSAFNTFIRAAIVGLLLHGVPIGLGVLMLRQRRWALLAMLPIAAMIWLWMTSILFGVPAPFSGYEDRPILKGRIFLMLDVITLAQLVSLFIALRAKVGRR
jgi:eukaryotic-like serine/threonine-protein kinase